MKLCVSTSKGKVEGFEKDGLVRFLGIPYAQQPKGELRFRRAREADAWDGVLKADHYTDAAPQFDHGMRMGSEDCLSLNIVRPAGGDRLPVYVWIHGGGYMTGCASDPLYEGKAFAENGILFVSIQYRLNVLGFFDFRSYPGCEDFETNRGLSDMILALRWVHENIAAFGGDPANVTIGGESAGGSAVVTLMAVPAVRGLFRQVIAESALCNCVMTQETARRNMDLYMEGMGWQQSDLGQLRTMPVLDMIRGLGYLSETHQYRNPGIFLPGPVIDDLLPVRPIDAIRGGSARGVRLIIGTNLHEGTMFVHPEKTGFPNSWDMVREMFRKNGNEAGFDEVQRYYGQENFDRDYGTTFVHLAMDYAFLMPSLRTAEAQSAWGSTYLYRFEFLSKSAAENGMLVSHAFDLPCVFGVKDHEFSRLFFQGETEETTDRIIADMQKPWMSFIRNGAPDPAEWPEYTSFVTPTRIFDRTTRTETIDYRKLMQVWGGMRFYEG